MEKKISTYLYGRRNVQEYLELLAREGFEKKNFPVKQAYVLKESLSELKKSVLKELPSFVSISGLTNKEIDKILPKANHQGVILVRDANKLNKIGNFQDLTANVSEKDGPIVLLDRIQDPGNLGNILRTSECLGVRHVIMSDRDTAPISPAVERSSSGAIHYLDLYRVANLRQSLDLLKEKGYWIVATSDTGEADWSNLPPAQDIAILMGNEGEGLKPILLEHSDFIVQIPMLGSVSSLNVGVALGIALDRLSRNENEEDAEDEEDSEGIESEEISEE